MEQEQGRNKMKKGIKKVCVCLLAAFLAISSGAVTDTKAASYEWNGSGYWSYYDTPDEARNYTIGYDDEYQAAVAVNGYINLKYEDTYYDDDYDEVNYQWEASNQNINMEVSADKKSAKITGKTKGTTNITITKTYKDEYDEEPETETKTVKIQISQPKLKSTKIGMAVGTQAKVQITGNSSYGKDRILYATDNTSNFWIYDGSMYGYKKQTRKVYVYVDGVILTATVKCTDPKLSRTVEILQKGQTASYALKGTSGYTPVTYATGNKKYATVSKAGKVKGIKYGKTTFTAKADNQTWKFDLYILKAQTYKAVSKAHAIYKTHPVYSQAKRMKDGYVDCSSFVWKSYKGSKIYFGDKNYAPTAANIAKWCSKNKKLLSLSTYNGKSSKLQPGDLIFYKKRSGNNGRYKNIDHVAMYVGNDTIVHADGSSVSYRDPWYRKVAAIARP